MTMAISNVHTTFALAGLCLCFTLAINVSTQDCQCQGPTNFYKELGCTPVFKNPDDCCPIRFDCSVLSDVVKNQCLINGHVYQNGESLRDEDRNICDSCSCYAPEDRVADFMCAQPMCMMPLMPNESCHFVWTDKCCGGRTVCPKDDGSFATCIVDGKTYSDGEAFVPSTEPYKRCHCAEGYTGENVEPYCVSPKHTWCDNVLHWQAEIRTCVPLYPFGVSPQTGCNNGFRCPSGNDVVIEGPNKTGTGEPEDPDMLCKFGNLPMRVGDELYEDPSSTVKCVCQVPPVPTCRVVINKFATTLSTAIGIGK